MGKSEIEEYGYDTELNPDLYRLFNHSSAVIILKGKRGNGKTNYGLRLYEQATQDGLITNAASNIIIKDDTKIQHITNFPDLDQFLKFQKGKKMFILDEAGVSVPSNRWMSTLAVRLLATVQLIRHYNARMIFIAPSDEFIVKYLKHPSLRDCEIEKKSWRIAEVKNYLTDEYYHLHDIKPTTISYSQEPTIFTLEKPLRLDRLAEYERDLYEYGVLNKSMRQIAQDTGRQDMQVLRSIKKFAKIYFESKTS